MSLQQDLSDFLLKNIPDATKASGGREIVMRCRFCGDSQTDFTAKHLYVSLGDDNKPPMYNCFKCTEHGLLTIDALRRMLDLDSINDLELMKELHSTTSSFLKKNGIRNRNKTTYNIKWDYITKDSLSDAKLLYINRRLGLNMTYDDVIANKIVLNLNDLLNYNHIDRLTRDSRSVDELSESFLGFLSMNNGHVTMRNLRPGKVSKYVDHRYIDYSIFDADNNSRRFYSIPTKCNILDPEPITVHIAEGAFDILGIFYHLCNANRYQNLYINCGDKAYFNVIKMLILDYGLINCKFNIYIDNDVDPRSVYINTLGREAHMIRNVFPGEKDFGVTPDRIKLQYLY